MISQFTFKLMLPLVLRFIYAATLHMIIGGNDDTLKYKMISKTNQISEVRYMLPQMHTIWSKLVTIIIDYLSDTRIIKTNRMDVISYTQIMCKPPK